MVTSLNQPERFGLVVARCLNFTEQPMKLSAEPFTGIEENEVDDREQRVKKAEQTVTQPEMKKYQRACRNYIMQRKS